MSIALDPECTADEMCCFIGTTAAIILAASAAASAGTQIYAAHASSSANQHAADTQANTANHAADVSAAASDRATQAQLQAAQDALQVQRDQLTRDQAEYERRQQQMSPYVAAGQGALASLQAGLGVHSVPQPPPLRPGETGAAPPTSVPTPNAAPTSAPASPASPTLADLNVPPSSATPQQPQTAQNSTSQMPNIGEQRVVSGQNAVWDGRGWRAV